MATFNRTEYNRQYYFKNKEKLDQRRLDNYHKNKGLKTLYDYVKNHLDSDMEFVRDELLKTDETDPEQVEYCIELMKLAKILLLMKSRVLQEDQSEIERLKNIQIPVLFTEDL